MLQLLIAIAGFLATHVVLAENPVRAALVRVLGERPFAWAYGIIAIAQLIWIDHVVDAMPNTTRMETKLIPAIA